MLSTIVAMMAGEVCAEVPMESGGYAEANIGFVHDTSSGLGWGNVYGLNAALGYKFMPFLAVEIGYGTYGDSDYSFTGSQVFDMTSKIILPFPEAGFDVFAKLGASHINNSGSNGNLSLFYGIGGEYAFSRNFLIVVQWAQAGHSGTSGDIQFLSVGANVIFDKVSF
jgi:hypothetical protein